MPESGSMYCFSISAFLRTISQSMMTVSIVRMRLMRQRAATISLTRSCSAGVAGWWWAARCKHLVGTGSRVARSGSGGELFLQFLEFIFVFAFEEDGVAGRKTVAQGVARGFFLRFGGLGAAGFSSVGSGSIGP